VPSGNAIICRAHDVCSPSRRSRAGARGSLRRGSKTRALRCVSRGIETNLACPRPPWRGSVMTRDGYRDIYSTRNSRGSLQEKAHRSNNGVRESVDVRVQENLSVSRLLPSFPITEKTRLCHTPAWCALPLRVGAPDGVTARAVTAGVTPYSWTTTSRCVRSRRPLASETRPRSKNVHLRRPSSPRQEDGLRLRRLRLTPHSPSLAHPSRIMCFLSRTDTRQRRSSGTRSSGSRSSSLGARSRCTRTSRSYKDSGF